MKRRGYSILLIMAFILMSLAIACGDNTTAPPAGGTSPAPSASPATGGTATKPGGPVTAEKAKELYQTRCQACHGEDGKGKKDTAPTSPDFADAEWQKKKTDEELTKSINEGLGTGKGAMPKWKNLLTPEEVSALVVHVRNYAKK